MYFRGLPQTFLYLKKNKNTPAKNCKNAKMKLTVFVGNLPKSFAPKTPPAVTPIAVGTSTDGSSKPRIA